MRASPAFALVVQGPRSPPKRPRPRSDARGPLGPRKPVKPARATGTSKGLQSALSRFLATPAAPVAGGESGVGEGPLFEAPSPAPLAQMPGRDEGDGWLWQQDAGLLALLTPPQ